MTSFTLRMKILIVYLGTLDERNLLESDFYVYDPN